MKTSTLAFGSIVSAFHPSSRGGARVTADEVRDAFSMLKKNDGRITKDEFEAVAQRANLYTERNSTVAARQVVKDFLAKGFESAASGKEISSKQGFRMLLGQFDNVKSAGGKKVTPGEISGILKLANEYPDADVLPAMQLVATKLYSLPASQVQSALKAVNDWFGPME